MAVTKLSRQVTNRMTATSGHQRVTRGASAAPALIGVGVFLLVGLTWAGLVLPNPSVHGYLGLAIIALSLAALAADSITGRLGPLSLTFWSFMAVWTGFAPLYQFTTGRLPWIDVPATELYPLAQLLTLGAAIAYRVGQVSANHRKPRTPFQTAVPRTFLGGFLLPLLAFPLAALSGVSLASRFQSRDELIAAYAAQGLEYGDGGGALLGVLKTLPICITAVGLYLVVYEIKRRRRIGEKIRLPLLIALTFAGAAAVTFANPLSNSRFQGFSAALMLLFVLVSFKTVFKRTLLSLGLVVGLLVAYPLSAVFKNEVIASRVYFRPEIFLSVDFDGFQQTVNAIWYVQHSGHTLGYHLVSALGFFIPRSIWDGKALPASYPVAESRGYTFQNLALPLWAEMYVEFGVIGMLLVFFLIARYSRRADLAFTDSGSTRLAIVTPVLAAVQIGLLRGPLGAQVVFAGTCVALAVVLTRRENPPDVFSRNAPTSSEANKRLRVVRGGGIPR
ncbi:hypothetical protein R2Q81_02570 [Microbacterium aquimaris]|uniref:hypothetical protein n=1 Tax=Microbacterium aquimaris TaxID=459816 RepID=UPI002AD24DFF|nr:hypothetical protein [Microbacterium aquimaris]MDZ8274825.1 hypothetical protein [Microbacterium aquimaris]